MRLRPWLVALGVTTLAASAAAQNLSQHPPTRTTGTISAPSASSPGPKVVDTYGTPTSFHRVGFSEFSPANSNTTFSDLSQFSFTFSRYPTANESSAFVAVPHLPSGALLNTVEYDWCDTNAGLDTHMDIYASSYTGSGGTLLGTVSSSGSGGCDFTSVTLATPYQIDNNNNQIILVAFVPATDSSLAISGAIMRYTLQVSPAPPIATFGDVPAGSLYFQFVEALAASGVTAGCDAVPNYCPDRPITRAEMAVFLAKALGLQFQ